MTRKESTFKRRMKVRIYDYIVDGEVVYSGTAKEMGEYLNVSDGTVKQGMEGVQMRPELVTREIDFAYKKNYAIYAFYRGEEFITTGTIEEIAEETGLSIHTVKNYSYKKAREIGRKSLVVRLEED